MVFGKVEAGMEVLRFMENEGSASGKTEREVLLEECEEVSSAGMGYVLAVCV